MLESFSKIAIVGAHGNMGAKRVRALEHLFGVKNCEQKLVLCDLATNAESGSPYRFEADFQQLLDDSEISHIIISLPNSKQRDTYLLDCIAHGKHVLIEKPISLDQTVIEEAFSLALSQGILLKTAFNLDFFPGVQKVKGSMGKLGKIKFLNTIYGNGGFNPEGEIQEWFLNPQLTAGVENFMGSHMASLLWMFAGDQTIEHVNIEKQYNQLEHIADTAIITVRLSEMLFTSTVSWSLWKNRFLFSLGGDDGLANIDGFVKYIKYGQEGEAVNLIERTAGMPREDQFLYTYENTDRVSVDVEFVDAEIKDWIEKTTHAKLHCNDEFKKNLFIHRCVTMMD